MKEKLHNTPKPMTYSILEIASILHIPSREITAQELTVSVLLTDSRSLTYPDATLFFALKTNNDDGHHYIESLFNQGVRNFVVEDMSNIARNITSQANFLVVPDTLDALQAIATAHRKRFRIPVIGITGSYGKTTVKEWLYQLLKDDYHIIRSPRSYNSQIGVPLSIWDIDDSCDLAIIEAGISTVHEMGNLQTIIRPNIGIITNIGNQHNEGFDSMQQKAEEKAKILSSCENVIYHADDRLVSDTIEPIIEADIAHVIGWSSTDSMQALYIKHVVKLDDRHSEIDYVWDGDEHRIEVPFVRNRDIENVVNCLAVMLLLGEQHDVIAERMAILTPVGTRINVIEGINNCTIIADGYTSDYNSLTPAIDFMYRRAGAHRNTIILSDLLPEVYGKDELYIRVSELLKNKRVTRFIGIGTDMCAHERYFKGVNAKFYHTTQEFLTNTSQGDFEEESILVKGAPQFDFQLIVDMLEAKQHQTVLEVDLGALAHNFKFFKSQLSPGTKTVGMVKASAYGAGAFEVAKTLQDRGADYLAVAVQDEGIELRRSGINMPIIVLNPTPVNFKTLFTHSLEPEVYSLDMCRQLIHEADIYGIKHHPIHIKIDSGMHRLGFTREQLPELIEMLSATQTLRVVSVFSHLSVADDPEQDDYTEAQVDYFCDCAEFIQQHFGHYILRHILNTSGIIRFPQYQFDMVRIGIGLYGMRTVDGEDELRPVSSLHSVIISINEWPAGTTVGYGRHGLLQRDSRIATVTIGYGDGLDRHFGNGAVSMWVDGKLCPTVGNVCMDAVMIDVTDTKAKVGDAVEIFGTHVPVDNLAKVRGTISYEILTSIAPRVKRVYYRE